MGFRKRYAVALAFRGNGGGSDNGVAVAAVGLSNVVVWWEVVKGEGIRE